MSGPRTTTATEFRGISLPAGLGYEYREDLLERLFRLFQHMIEGHSKVFIFRFDLHFPVGRDCPDDNRMIIRFMDSYTGTLDSQGLAPEYLWVREQTASAPNHHYHCIVLLDGHKTQHPAKHLETAERLWTRALGLPPEKARGLVDSCREGANGNPHENCFMMRRNDPNRDTAVEEWFGAASYLAKTYSKGSGGYRVRDFGSSRV